jgi:hypothetical protein
MMLPFGQSEGSLRNFHIVVRDRRAEVFWWTGFPRASGGQIIITAIGQSGA